MQNAEYDNLVVLTDHPDPELIFLSYTVLRNGNRDVPELKTVHHLSLYERSARPAEFFNDMLLDVSGGVLVVSCYAGKLKVVLLEGGGYGNDFDVSWVLSIGSFDLCVLRLCGVGSQSFRCWTLLSSRPAQRTSCV
jgi:DNA damage-binding protein 1